MQDRRPLSRPRLAAALPTVRRLSPVARLRALLGADAESVRQSVAALALSLLASFVAGLTLGSIEGTLEALPGLLVLVPAAIGMRGTVFGALGSRLSTAIHTGTFSLSWRSETVVGQNVLAAAATSLSTSVALAFLAKAVAVAFDVPGSIGVTDLVVISVLGGLVSSAVVLVLTVALAAGSVRRDWDLDNVMAPLVTAAGDMVTLPALWLATHAAGRAWVTPALGLLLTALGLGVVMAVVRSRLRLLRRIVAESLPVVLVGALLGLVAGLVIEKRLQSFLTYPALLVLVPPFLASAGSLGGILSSRLSSAIHLGTIDPAPLPDRRARRDIALVYALALPVFALVSVVADVGALVAGLATPGPLRMVGVALLGGVVATAAVVVVAYYGTVIAWRFGVDPDTYGIPVVTSTVDLVGAFALVLAIVALGLS